MAKRTFTRRTFLTGAAAGMMIGLPGRIALGQGPEAPSQRLRVAGVGAGGQAMHDLGQVSRVADIVALADVDQARSADAFKRWPAAKGYIDWREMLDKEQANIDAVVIACPDHLHAAAASAAMQLGKHVYVEKPMAHEINEVRHLVALAEKTGVVTQMGNQGHTFPSCHRMKYWIEQGAIGPVREIHCWTNRPTWPQGIERPADTPPVPDTLNWDLWLGPAPERPYHPAYCPRNWRGWWDFGTGALGDMGCHVFDAPYFGLQLGAPTRITAESEGATADSGPLRSKITYEFPERGPGLPACTLVWYDGGHMPPRPEGLEADKPIGDKDGGSVCIGEKATIVAGTYSNGAKILTKDGPVEPPAMAEDAYATEGHHRDWVAACKGEGVAQSHFAYAGGLTEVVLLGTIALRVQGLIEWDPAAMRIPNNPEANALLQRVYRPGWELA